MKQILKKINHKNGIQVKTLTTCFMVLLYLLGGNVWGQSVKVGEKDGVTVYYEESKKTITITNNSGYSILLFKSNLTASKNAMFNKDVNYCNLNINSLAESENFYEILDKKTSDPISINLQKEMNIIGYKATWKPTKTLHGQISIPISPVKTSNTPSVEKPIPNQSNTSTPPTTSTSTSSSSQQNAQTPSSGGQTASQSVQQNSQVEKAKTTADSLFNKKEWVNAKSAYEQLKLYNSKQYSDHANSRITVCDEEIKKQQQSRSNTPKPQTTNPKPQVSNNKQIIADFNKQIDVLQEESAPLLQKDCQLLTNNDSIYLCHKQTECTDLKTKIGKFKQTLTTKTATKQDNETLDNFSIRLDGLYNQISKQLMKMTLTDEEIAAVINNFKIAISYDQLSTSLDSVKRFIDDNKYKSDWYNWLGQKNTLNQLSNIEKKIAIASEQSEKFIDSIYKFPKYQNAAKTLKDNFTIHIQSKGEEYRNILNGEDFKVPVKVFILAAAILIFVIIVIILLYMIIHNKKKEIEKKKIEEEKIEKLGKSTFKKIGNTDVLQNNENTEAESGNSSSVTGKPKIKLLKNYEHGLSEVKANIERTYKEIDMFELWDDTSIHKVYISRDFIKELYKFFNEFLKSDGKVPETGCYITGRWDYAPNTNQQAYDISLEYMVKPGRDARYSEYECDFGVEIGTSLIMANRQYSEQFNTEFVHTSWMHSHPGLQLFLSKQDLIVQATLTNNSPYKRMLAIVIDTKTEYLEMALFSPKASEQQVMNNDTDIKKTITLDELLKWAKMSYSEPQKPEQKPESEIKITGTPAKEYFDIVNKFKITRAVSVDMLTANEGVFIGKYENNQIFIDELREVSAGISNRIGFFKEISTFENPEEWNKQKQNLLSDEFWKSNKVLAIYCLQDENLYFFTEKPNEQELETQNQGNIAVKIPFQELKNWTRKNRN